MKTFSVTVEETFTKRYEVEAESAAEARQKVYDSLVGDEEFSPAADSDADYSNRIYDVYSLSEDKTTAKGGTDGKEVSKGQEGQEGQEVQ